MGTVFFQIYDTLAEGVGEGAVRYTAAGPLWALAESERGAGLAMAAPGDTRPAMVPGGLAGLAAADRAGLRSYVERGVHGHPYGFGVPFVLGR